MSIQGKKYHIKSKIIVYKGKTSYTIFEEFSSYSSIVSGAVNVCPNNNDGGIAMEKKLDISALGKKIKQYRAQKGYSAEKLGEIAGVSKSHINNIESANARASAEVLVRIANALEVSVDILLCDSLNGKASRDAMASEFSGLLEECSEQQTKIIVNTVKTLRENLRELDGLHS